MIKLTNPTDKEIGIIFEGVSFTIDAKSSKDLPEDVATFWLGIHGFLQVGSSTVQKEEVVEDATEEVEEKPKKKAAKKATKKTTKTKK